MGNIVAIVGRPNVGKSTLFNRLTQTRQAIVDDEAGTTRDRNYGKVEWTGKKFSLIDTGGWVVNSDDIFEEEINKQVHIAIEEADVILFVVDVLNGITDLDTQVAQILRRSKKPLVLVANKADNFDLHYSAAEFYAFGLGDPFEMLTGGLYLSFFSLLLFGWLTLLMSIISAIFTYLFSKFSSKIKS